MRTVHEVSELTGVSVRALQYYDRIGLLKPAEYTAAGYRLYDEAALERLQQILLFRELEFPLKDIRQIVNSPDFDRGRALDEQIALLALKKEHIENLIALAREIRQTGVKHSMSFDAFDTSRIDEYAAQAKAQWGATAAYGEYEKKSRGRTAKDNEALQRGMMALFARFGALRQQDPAGEAPQCLVRELQDFITEHFYTCTDDILRSLGAMYSGGGEFTETIDREGGEGTAAFAARAIEVYCAKA